MFELADGFLKVGEDAEMAAVVAGLAKIVHEHPYLKPMGRLECIRRAMSLFLSFLTCGSVVKTQITPLLHGNLGRSRVLLY